uniref:Uncharacterized protein n=1 Tax=Sphaerodactylus townsendi TaxID=933632 RepID=A0ACB8FDS6_9SAUR
MQNFIRVDYQPNWKWSSCTSIAYMFVQTTQEHSPSEPFLEKSVPDMTQVSGPNAQLLKSDDYLSSIEQQPPQQKKKKKKNNHVVVEGPNKGFGKEGFPGGLDGQDPTRKLLDCSQEEKKKKKKPKVKKEPKDPKELKEKKEPKEPKTPKTPKIPKEPKEKKAKNTTPKPKSNKKAREGFGRSAAEGTRSSRAKTIAFTEAPAEDLRKKKKAAGKDGTAPASKRPRGPATVGSLAPSEGAAVSGGSDTGSSYPMRDSESPVLPPGQEEPEAPVQATTSSTRQEPGPRGEGAESTDPSSQPATAATAVAAWHNAPPEELALLAEQIDKALEARKRRAAPAQAGRSKSGNPRPTKERRRREAPVQESH